MSVKDPAELIVRYLSNEASAEEQEKLLDWVSASAENQKTFHQYAAAWNREETRILQVNTARALHAVNARIDEIEHDFVRRRMVPLWLKIAATLLLLTAAGIFSLNIFTRDNTRSTYKQFATMRGQRTILQLPDGSRVHMNASSELAYPESFTRGTREVFLTGEAFFDVRHDAKSPFIVHTGDLTTTVLGTSFNIRADSMRVAVTVATGKVKITDGRHDETLLPEEQISYHRAQRRITKSRANLLHDLAWTTNTIIFDDTDLRTAAGILEAWFAVSIDITNPELAGCTITGTYHDESLAHILDAISFATGVRVQHNESGAIVISGRGCR